MNSQNKMAKIASFLSNNMTIVEINIDAALLNNDANHDMMRLLMHEMRYLKEKNSGASTILEEPTKCV